MTARNFLRVAIAATVLFLAGMGAYGLLEALHPPESDCNTPAECPGPAEPPAACVEPAEPPPAE